MLVLKALIRLAERVTLSKLGASEQLSAFVNRRLEDVFLRLTVKLCLNIVEGLPHHELKTIICHNFCFTGVVVNSNWMIRHRFRVLRRGDYGLYSARRDIKLGQYITVVRQM